MRILGIDPGSIQAGYAVIDITTEDVRNKKISAPQVSIRSSGTIKMDEKQNLATRLLQLGDDLDVLLKKHQPQELALESIFFAKNARSAIQLGQSRGVCLFMAAKYNLEIFEYSPTQVKAAIGGSGRASKEQIQHMVRVFLRLPAHYEFVSHDHADALAIALAHVHSRENSLGRLIARDCTTKRKTSLSESD